MAIFLEIWASYSKQEKILYLGPKQIERKQRFVVIIITMKHWNRSAYQLTIPVFHWNDDNSKTLESSNLLAPLY